MVAARRTSDTSDGNDRVEPRLLKASEAGKEHEVREIIDAQRNEKVRERLLAIGLLRSCERGHAHVARYLISQGAKTDSIRGNRVPPLLRAIQNGQTQIIELLIEFDTDLEISDKKGRTALMTAAWQGQLRSVQLLLARGALVNNTDHEKRHVMHNLAADTKCPDCRDVVEELLKTDIDLEAQDNLKRTALHWTAVTGHTSLAARLLQQRSHGSAANINAFDKRRRTPLHFAASHNRLDMAKLLIEHGADVHARSDGDWTPLHSACEKGSVDLVTAFLDAGAHVNNVLRNGRTPLHVAAENGNLAVVDCLLQRPGIKRITKDGFGDTPLLRAALSSFSARREIIEKLAPWNNARSLSADALDACKEFNATIVEFGNYNKGNKVTKRSVHDLLYADPKANAGSTFPRNKATEFSWIHLPANNITWCNALLTKRFIEEGANDVEGFKALERSFAHQHRGQLHHSHFMRPLCQVERRSPVDHSAQEQQKDANPMVVINGPVSITNGPNVLPTMPESPTSIQIESKQGQSTISASAGGDSPPSALDTHGRKNSSDAKSTPDRMRQRPRRNQTLSSESSIGSGRSPSRRKGAAAKSFSANKAAANNIYMFMPYLHFETDERRREMQTAVKSYSFEQDDRRRDFIKPLETASESQPRPPLSHDEKLIRAHLTASSSALHIRRTLDQYFYHNIDTSFRDGDQVVFRYQKRGQSSEDLPIDAKVVMVDQLWMWVLGKDLVVTSFPQRWKQPIDDPLNVLDGIIQDINSTTRRDPVQNVFELAILIAGRCSGTFDRHKKGDDDFPLVDMFEASIGNAMDLETSLFQEFSVASRQASSWLLDHRKPSRFTRNLNKAEKIHENREHGLASEDTHEPLFVDKLLDIGLETDLLAEIKDIRDELMIMRIILENQEQIIPTLQDSVRTIYKEERSEMQLTKVEKVFDESLKTIHAPLKDISRMDKQAERIYNSIRDLLDLKQKHANAFEARFARDQATGTVRQGQIILVFTVVTVIFLPMTFIASFFTMNISGFPHNGSGNQEVSLQFASKYIFGIGLAISLPCILVALSVDELSSFFGGLAQSVTYMWLSSRLDKDQDAARQLDVIAMEKTLTVARSTRRSVEVELFTKTGLPVPNVGRTRASMNRDSWRERHSWDIERG